RHRNLPGLYGSHHDFYLHVLLQYIRYLSFVVTSRWSSSVPRLYCDWLRGEPQLFLRLYLEKTNTKIFPNITKGAQSPKECLPRIIITAATNVRVAGFKLFILLFRSTHRVQHASNAQLNILSPCSAVRRL